MRDGEGVKSVGLAFFLVQSGRFSVVLKILINLNFGCDIEFSATFDFVPPNI